MIAVEEKKKSLKTTDDISVEKRPRTIQEMGCLAQFIINYRWIFVILFLIPISCIFNLIWWMRSQCLRCCGSAPAKHRERVAHVQAQVREWVRGGRKGQMCTARPGWLTMSLTSGQYKKTLRNIEVNLKDILEVDTERRVVRCEPLCTMGQVSAALLKQGWTLAVVPELDDLTVGGLICGVGVESSSHRLGLFAETCVAFEVVLADGSLVRCTKDEHADLFHAIPWSHGTLGFLVAAEISIVPATKYVRLQYIPIHTAAEGVRLFQEASKDTSIDFVEALQYTPDKSVLMLGHYSNTAEASRTNNISLWYKPWFFKHVESYLRSSEGVGLPTASSTLAPRRTTSGAVTAASSSSAAAAASSKQTHTISLASPKARAKAPEPERDRLLRSSSLDSLELGGVALEISDSKQQQQLLPADAIAIPVAPASSRDGALHLQLSLGAPSDAKDGKDSKAASDGKAAVPAGPSIKELQAARGAHVEFIPLRAYYHRHTKSLFWEMQDIIPQGNHPIFRVLLGWAMPPKISLLKLTTVGPLKELYQTQHVVQDMLVPLSTTADALKVFHNVFEVYPLWLCPFRIPQAARERRAFVQPLPDEELFVDIGAYGVPKAKDFHSRRSLQKVEEYVRSVKGYQMLYADSEQTREEFREMFDHHLYDTMRERLGCKDAFPEIYNKVSKKARGRG